VDPFDYIRPADADAATRSLRAAGHVALGGGTDLLATLKEGVTRAVAVVDLRRLPGLALIDATPSGGLRIGAAVRLADIAAHGQVRVWYPALAEACGQVGSPALRQMGTLGGNLGQRPRCWYWRQGVSCAKSGGTGCPAVTGENQYHAILEGGPCHIVHPSDPAVSLTALDATVHVEGPAGLRAVPIGEFFVRSTDTMERETVLQSGEWIQSVELPASSAGGTQRYAKLMQRGAWDFALVSLASVQRADGDVRLVLGGVGPRPYRVNSSIEEDVASGHLDEDSIAALAERALYDARPLSGNAYKVTMAQTLLRRAMQELAGV
jgi:xanthine dehydrogenase YagS FAD-binding subunit